MEVGYIVGFVLLIVVPFVFCSIIAAIKCDDDCNYNEWGEAEESPFAKSKASHWVKCMLVATAISAAFIFIMVAPYGGHWAWQPVDESDVAEIHSVKGLASESGGSFFLGVGSVRADKYYYFYQKAEDGSLVMTDIPAEDAYVVETDSVVPKFTSYCKAWYRKPSYRIYVPTSTVIISFSL